MGMTTIAAGSQARVINEAVIVSTDHASRLCPGAGSGDIVCEAKVTA
jgi:hypothetical protein